VTISVFDLFTIGIGPSSSHVVGPMRAARMFVRELESRGIIGTVGRMEVALHGSLAYTGHGHGTDRAVILGLMGVMPEEADPDLVPGMIAGVASAGTLSLGSAHPISFSIERDIVFDTRTSLAAHPNGMRFTAYDASGSVIDSHLSYSIGGGFVSAGTEAVLTPPINTRGPVLYRFESAEELLQTCAGHGMSISRLVMENETRWLPEPEVRKKLLKIWEVMQTCVSRGLSTGGMLPGGLGIPRRAPQIHQDLVTHPERTLRDPLSILDWVNLYALAVNEENAAGGRVVTAPTNGAAGIIPAVLHYYHRFCSGATDEGVIRFLLTAGAIGMLYKRNASISGAEVGCQGEVGVACSMAAAGLTAALGGTNDQIENAAEIGMEHNLGLTCDPIGGLVQIPCIERNAMAAVKAINATRIALKGDGSHKVSLDQVIQTMRQTGLDMKSTYKETSQGGLAVNVPEC
jgi:L-serine dehydratase